jgi:hypothetical protein
MFQDSQDEEYFKLCVNRVRTEYLVWVEQFLDIIQEADILRDSHHLTLNDIGCNVGQFWKGLKRRQLKVDYKGYDIETRYLKAAKEIFPEISDAFLELDIVKEKPRTADVSVASAVLEHFKALSPGLNNILESTNKLLILRTFLGDTSDQSIFLKKGAKTFYYINQYQYREILELLDDYGFSTSIVRDKFTDSMPKYLGQGIVRSQYIIIGKKGDE